MIKCLSILSAALWMTAATPALAQVELDLSGGAGYSSNSDYGSSTLLNASLGYVVGDYWSARVGYMDLGEFKLDSDLVNARITMSGPYLQAVRRFDTRFVSWELGLGVARLESEALLSGRVLDTETEWEPFLELALTRQVADAVSLKGSYYYFNDRLGSDVSAFAVGVRYSF